MADSMTGLKRTGYCEEFGEDSIGREVVVCGWAQRRRSLGALIFIDLRDRTGLIQLAFDSNTAPEVFEKANSVRGEFVLAAKGVVRRRDTANTKLATGSIEIAVTDLRILAKSETPPFEIVENSDVKDELLLKYRYLDLRRPDMQRSIMIRHQVAQVARDYFGKNGFLEIETPILIKSTPEGARDYLVPSRVQPGKFYALPQSPQLYKQLLMLSGFDRYMQIARCFRDEDLRADRQPEFTQIDLEMSFVDSDDVIAINEGFIKRLFQEVLGVDVPTPLLRLDYSKAMELYGSDKPDTRFGLMLTDLSDLVTDSGFKVFDGAVAAGGSVRAINVKGAYDKLTRKEIDKLAAFVKDYGAGGLAWSRLGEENISSSFEKFLKPETINEMNTRLDAKTGDVVLVIADADSSVVFAALGALRCEVAARLGMIPRDQFNFLWVTNFPMLEYSKEEKRYMAMHHPFTAPLDEDIDQLESAPATCRAKAYDIVLNGVELGGGSIRINDIAMQKRMFKALGISDETAQERFGYLLDAFKFGAPPHGGMAYGLDRVVMLMLGKPSIKDVIAFPKVQNASELMTACPAQVDDKQLRELHIGLTERE
jgi:aspartyl-tRNA synthetase